MTPEGYQQLLARRDAAEGPGAALAAALVASVEVVAPHGDTGTARFGHWVQVTLDGRPRWLRLVGPDEADAAQGLVPVTSPLGAALVGLGVGEPFEVERPSGLALGEVLAIALTPPPR